MNGYLNYFIEANLGLTLVALVYYVFLRSETDFSLKRKVLLLGILCSLTFPLFHFQNQAVSAFRDIVPTIWLPEFHVIGNASPAPAATAQLGPREIGGAIYAAGVFASMCFFVIRVLRIARLIRKLTPVKAGSLLIAETDQMYPSFSFFNFVVIGNAHSLNDREKGQIISHESIHAREYHSFDILVVNILRVFFWCNPVVHLYKNIFVQLHEFEADSRAVDNRSLDEYCSLLARVALMSADLRIANHFSNSLTLKRIQMMRAIKFKTKPWKLVTIATVVPVFFFGVACNDEAISEISDIAQETQMALDVPAHVQARYDELSKAYPEKKYILLEMSGTENQKLQDLEKKYGLPSSMEVFKEGKETITGKSEAGVVLRRDESSAPAGAKAFVILEYNQQGKTLSDLSNQDNVFTVVENTASFPGGMPEFYKFLAGEVSYPAEARSAGVQGKVFVEFIVETDGSVSNVAIKKGIHPAIDAEAQRAMSRSPKWNPGTQNGSPVRQKLVLPVNFSLGDETGLKKTTSLHDILNPLPPIKPKQDKC